MELHAFGRPPVAGQLQPHEIAMRKIAAVGQVVNGEHGFGARRLVGQKRRHQSGLPVVRMHHGRLPAEIQRIERQQRGHAREHREALGVVRPVLAAGIDIGIAGAVEQRRAIDHPQRKRKIGMARFQDARADDAFGAAHVDPAENAHLLELAQQRAIARQQQADIGAARVQGMRQAVEHIAEPAGFHQRIGFAGHKQNFHCSAFHYFLAPVIFIGSNQLQGLRKMAPSGGSRHFDRMLEAHPGLVLRMQRRAVAEIAAAVKHRIGIQHLAPRRPDGTPMR